MVVVEFQYNSISTIIQCDEAQKMSEICNNFLSKSNLSETNLDFIYNGFDKNLAFNQMANSFDKARKKVNILVKSKFIEDSNDKDALVRAKNIICPKCGVDAKIQKIDYNQIIMHECKNCQNINNIPLNKLEKTQMIKKI